MNLVGVCNFLGDEFGLVEPAPVLAVRVERNGNDNRIVFKNVYSFGLVHVAQVSFNEYEALFRKSRHEAVFHEGNQVAKEGISVISGSEYPIYMYVAGALTARLAPGCRLATSNTSAG